MLQPDGEQRAQDIADKPQQQLSGYVYISAMLRQDEGKYPTRTYRKRLPYFPNAKNCDHTYSVCATWDCIESWSCDWRLFFHRTEAGRRLARKLRINPSVDLNHGDHLRILKHEDYVIEDPA